MMRLESQSGHLLFAPLIWRLAMKMEQISWNEMVSSPAEAIYVLRSAQRLFKQDVHCASFDTWMEAEAAGIPVERDSIGMPIRQPDPNANLRSVEDVLSSPCIVHTTEVIRRLASEPGVIPVATMTGEATLNRRLRGNAALHDVTPDRLAYIKAILLGLTRLYCEAGAGALLLLEEETDHDFSELREFAAIFNLAEYFATPVFLLSRGTMSANALTVLNSLGVKYLSPQQAAEGIVVLPPAERRASVDHPWLAMSCWEVDPETDPNVVSAWRQSLCQA